MYTVHNYQTKKELKADLARGVAVAVFQPGLSQYGKRNGRVTIEGPHYPQPHRWYANAIIEDGVIEKLLD